MATSRKQIDISAVSIRELAEADLPEVDRLWRSDHWDYGITTLRFITDQECCEHKAFVAVYNGEIIGTGIAYIVNEEVGTLGGFFVKPEYRYQGIGQKIWDARMRYLGDRNVMVNVFSKRADKNVRLGFTHLMEEMTMYIGVPNSREYNEEEFKQDVDRFISIQDANFDELMAYDSGISKQGNRGHYLKTLIQKYKIRGYVAYKDGAVVGYIGEMPSDEMFMIVPLYSQSASVAKALLKKCISELPDGFPVYLLSPNSNDNVGVLVREIGLEKEDGTKCLLSRNSYEVDWGNVYSVLSPVTFIC